jgi:peptide/nickel transport system substrate-binding protein
VVRITLPAPMGGLLRLARLPILPKHLLDGVAVGDLADSAFSARPVGNGRFRLLEIDARHAILAAVAQPAAAVTTGSSTSSAAPASPTGSAAPASPSPTVGHPIGVIELRFFDLETEAARAFVAGEIDSVSGLRPGVVEAAQARPGAVLARYPWANLTAVVLNQRQAFPEFGSRSARQALLAAIDREGSVTRVLGGRGTVADAPLPAWSAWYDEEAVKAVPYRGAWASFDLVAAGWARLGDGLAAPGKETAYTVALLTLDEASDPIVFRVAQQVASDWRALGLSVDLKTVPVDEYLRSLRSGEFQAAVVTYRLGLDPDLSPLLLSSQIAPAGSNLSGISDATLDRLANTVRTTAGEEQRRTAVSELQAYVTSNVLMSPVCFSDYVFAVSSRVSGRSETHIADPSDRYWDVLDWRLASDG